MPNVYLDWRLCPCGAVGQWVIMGGFVEDKRDRYEGVHLSVRGLPPPGVSQLLRGGCFVK